MTNVFFIKSNYSKHCFDNQYLELKLTEMNSDGTEGERTFTEIMMYDQYTKELWKYLTAIEDEDMNTVHDINVRFNSGNEYTLNSLAQMNIGMEMFSFIWDMKNRTFTHVPGENEQHATIM